MNAGEPWLFPSYLDGSRNDPLPASDRMPLQ
jgi:hypothetical protein